MSSRKVLQSVLERHAVPVELFGPVCVVVDKIEKIKAERVRAAPALAVHCRLHPRHPLPQSLSFGRHTLCLCCVDL